MNNYKPMASRLNVLNKVNSLELLDLREPITPNMIKEKAQELEKIYKFDASYCFRIRQAKNYLLKYLKNVEFQNELETLKTRVSNMLITDDSIDEDIKELLSKEYLYYEHITSNIRYKDELDKHLPAFNKTIIHIYEILKDRICEKANIPYYLDMNQEDYQLNILEFKEQVYKRINRYLYSPRTVAIRSLYETSIQNMPDLEKAKIDIITKMYMLDSEKLTFEKYSEVINNITSRINTIINLVTNIRERATREIKNNPAKKNNINLILASVIEIMNQNLRSDIPVTDLIDLTNSILFNDYEEDKNTINNFLHPEVKTL